MKKIMKAVSVILLAAMLFSVCACSTSGTVATVGDQKITLSQFKSAFTNYQNYMGYYIPSYDLTTEDGLKEYQDYILDLLVRQSMYVYQAGQNGITLNEDELADAKATAESDYKEIYDSYVSYAEQSGASDPNAYANNQLASVLSASGLTVKSFKEELLQSAINSTLSTKMQAALKNQGTPSAEELQAMYEKELAAQKEAFDADPSQYFTYDTNWSYYTNYGYDLGTCMPLYKPAGLFYVRHILVADKETADSIYAQLKDGADFETLLAEHNTDTGEDSYPDGYVCGQGASFVAPFLEAALALEKEGDISEPVESTYGWHIIRRGADIPAGEVDYETVRTEVEAYFTNSALNTFLEETMEKWLAEDGVVTKFESVYRAVK